MPPMETPFWTPGGNVWANAAANPQTQSTAAKTRIRFILDSGPLHRIISGGSPGHSGEPPPRGPGGMLCSTWKLVPPAARKRWESVTPAVIAGLAALLLFWGLTDKYLWQDEAIMAVLATRMLQFGRPLAYDGVNLLTTDTFAGEDEQTIDERTTAPQAAVDYHARRGDFKPDFAWKWQPWGQFVVAAIGLKLLGHTTLGARLPFTLTGLAAVLLLFRFVRQRFDSLLMATLAALLLVTNAYWILHARQARYYPISSLFLVLALMAYARWQSGAPGGAIAFATTAWCWFQVDYGTVCPVLGG